MSSVSDTTCFLKNGLAEDEAKSQKSSIFKQTDNSLRESFHSVEDIAESTHYQLQVHLKQGHDLAPRDSCGTSDPYVKFLIDNKLMYKSKTIDKDLNPFWDEKFYIYTENLFMPLAIKVFRVCIYY